MEKTGNFLPRSNQENLKRDKTKVFLVETSVEEQNRLDYSNNGPYSLGLAYLESILEKEGYGIITKDFAEIKEEECLKNIREIILNFKPEVMGISMMSMTRSSSYKAIKIAKELNPKIKIVVGGIHASIMWKQLLENFPIDCIIIGEGEETIRELLQKLIKNEKLDKIKGIAFKKGKKIQINPARELIEDLDKLPFPAHESFMNPKRTKVCILSSRGCPNNCSFCSLHIISKRKYRQRSYKNVVDEIEYIVKKFPQIKKIEFSDDTFTLIPERVINFCKEIIKRKIKVEILCSGRIKPMTEEMLYWMEKANFVEIRFGIETGSRKMLKEIHKNITPEDIIETFKLASKFKKIRFVKFLMVGFPGENNETITETIELTKKLQKIVPMDFFYATPLWVYPGTEIYQKMKEAGKIDDEFWLSDKPCPHYTVEYSDEELFNMSNRIGFETSLDRGYLFFIKLVIKKLANNPKNLINRAVKSRFLLPVLVKKLS